MDTTAATAAAAYGAANERFDDLGGMMFTEAQIATFVASMVYTLFGVIVFGITFWVVTKITPFSVRKEIEEDQNTALGIIIGAVIIGLAIIIGAAITG